MQAVPSLFITWPVKPVLQYWHCPKAVALQAGQLMLHCFWQLLPKSTYVGKHSKQVVPWQSTQLGTPQLGWQVMLLRRVKLALHCEQVSGK